jgi:predicted Zn-dependent protease
MQSRSTNNDGLAQKLARMESYLAQDPANPLLLADIIDLSLQAGRIDLARSHVDTARSLLPDDVFFQQREGHVLIAEEDFTAAVVIFSRLHAQHADAALGYDLAYGQFRLGQYRDAQATLQPYLALPAPSAASVTLMLRCLHHQGQLRAALDLVALHGHTCGEDQAFLAAASLLYLDDGQMVLARYNADLAMAGDTPPLEAMVVGATVALGQGDLTVAARHYQAVLQRKPDEGRSWSGIGLVSLLQRDLGRAAVQLEQAILYMPQHIGTRHVLGWCKILSHDLDAAAAIFRAALALERNFGETHGALAVIAALRGDRADAEEGIRRALGLDPNGLSARYAQMLLSGGASDPVKLKAQSYALLAERSGPFGGTMADMLVKFTR